MTLSYQEAITYLDNLQLHKIKLGLGAMRSFLADIGQPEQRLKIVHVAGTNGKGSVSASLLHVLQKAGYTVGLYTSPHLSCVRERFRINDTFISEEDFARLSQHIIDVLGENTITYFEFTTALAFLWFEESGLDLVILETGLGGRLDATNVTEPLVSVITSISMDHEAYLGNTLREVAGEKAGIIKPGIPVVAANGHEDVVAVLKETVKEQNAPLYLLGEDFSYSGESNDDWSWNGGTVSPDTLISGLKCSMRGAYQRENASLVIAVLQLLNNKGFTITEDNLRSGLASVIWPGRLEYIVLEKASRKQIAAKDRGESVCVRYLLDGAHNPAGLKNLSMTLADEYSYKKLIVVWGAMIDKDIAAGLSSMLPLADTLILTTPIGERSAEPEQLAAFLPEELQTEVVLVRDVAEALRQAEQKATEDDIIVVAGSLYLVGAVRKILVGELVEQE
ncbi:bifunctional folylpolyglutamate synthase/dihydrofolate synthase [Desulfosediminicola flagellatus]|uniref:bifunctional folylpolyglutamate synthase/dihydrofolate synthase n=1 Tax=Desulfosediminicola flagellatus TaxID=2569541 RepID=UPI0010ACCDE1|nr:folylpolyglutamate synthase/dihydrofolate synthase family protein [Desulfosediminicola flagellatus]